MRIIKVSEKTTCLICDMAPQRRALYQYHRLTARFAACLAFVVVFVPILYAAVLVACVRRGNVRIILFAWMCMHNFYKKYARQSCPYIGYAVQGA